MASQRKLTPVAAKSVTKPAFFQDFDGKAVAKKKKPMARNTT